MDCAFCERKVTKYRCTVCGNHVCNVCSEPVDINEKGYDEGNYRVGKCPRGACINTDSELSTVVEENVKRNSEGGGEVAKLQNKSKKKRSGDTGKPVNIFNYFGKARGKGNLASLKSTPDDHKKDAKASSKSVEDCVKTHRIWKVKIRTVHLIALPRWFLHPRKEHLKILKIL